MLVDLEKAVGIMENVGPLLDAFMFKAPQGTTATRNFATYCAFSRGNLQSKLLQVRAQEAIAADDVDAARELLAQVFELEETLYRTGIADVTQWAEAHKDSPRVQALGLAGVASAADEEKPPAAAS